MYKSIVAALFIVIAHATAQAKAQVNGGPATTGEVIEHISDFRRIVLQDTSKVDFCAVADAFDAGGNFKLPHDTRPPRYSTRAECQAAPNYKTGPTVKRVRVTGDTVVVTGSTQRGNMAILEEYRFVPNPFGRSPQSRFNMMYCITGLIQS